ncbi:sodium-translocating pyrophosphatase [Candidatus Micrarchaeota archaeon]|nr:sodium-translocating pyrophosphatase [Candidatus Micrarchaeota archaeon]MBU2477416.1 sodium-translocating pyrophosphatase [Candidatus Micrarchaeota archaeon]
MELVFYAILAGIIALLYTVVLNRKINSKDMGNAKMKEISAAIREGAMAFLKREYKTLAVFIVAVFIILTALSQFYPQAMSFFVGVSFIVGALCSALAGWLGMNTATKSNVRTTQAATTSMSEALKVAFSSGAVMGLSVVGLGILGISVLYYIYSLMGFENPTVLLFGFSFGASSIALFARVGGGIYTKAADVGADLVGKVEAGIPEDDPRNPAVIADNVGDNVGDVAGMGADLFESYVGSIIASMALGLIAFNVLGMEFPLALASIGIIASILGVIYVNLLSSEKGVHSALRNGTLVAAGIMVVLTYIVMTFMPLFSGIPIQIFYSMVTGLIVGILIGFLTEYYTAHDYKPTREVSNAANTGAGTNIIAGLALGYKSTALPVLVLGAGMYFAYYFGGLYGIGIAAVGMLSTLGITLAVDAYGPVADNAGGIAEMAGLNKKVRKVTDSLDAAGNTTAAIGKGFAIGSAALTALALFATFGATTGLESIDIMKTNVMVGLLIGAMLPFLFSSFAMTAVGQAAQAMVEEVRRQFKEIKGLMEGKAKPDYKTCVEISTSAAMKKMIVPGLLAVLAPIIVGLILGPEGLGGMLAGALVSGVMMAIMMANAGGSWDNAKKYIELGNFGGKGSNAHKAAVTGDTVGDPFKDTAGPSLNILIKLMSIVSLIFASILMVL